MYIFGGKLMGMLPNFEYIVWKAARLSIWCALEWAHPLDFSGGPAWENLKSPKHEARNPLRPA
jgi:hypothetical protein